MSEWRGPDDSFLTEKDASGVNKGTRRVRAALRRHSVPETERILTSQDPLLQDLRDEMKRDEKDLPHGVEQWQLPIVLPLEDVALFMSEIAPDTTVPEHAHPDVWVFRVVIEGEVEVGDVTLGPGDWMLVPPGMRYSLKTKKKKLKVFYGHCLRRR